jgi:hypothetical protein
MESFSQKNQLKVVKMLQELLLEEQDRTSITPALISNKINDVLRIMPSWGEGLDSDAVTDELIRRFSLWIGQDSTLIWKKECQRWIWSHQFI